MNSNGTVFMVIEVMPFEAFGLRHCNAPQDVHQCLQALTPVHFRHAERYSPQGPWLDVYHLTFATPSSGTLAILRPYVDPLLASIWALRRSGCA